MNFKLITLSPICTGGLEKNDNSVLHITGIKGSIRWWYEALIRGLGYYACDLASDEHCELKGQKNALKDIKDKICPACYLFGCTGWSGKFILRLTEPDNRKIINSLSKQNIPFRLRFINIKALEPAEESLLQMTIKLIVDFGAIGGKTILKPSENKEKNKSNYKGGIHQDYGLTGRFKNKNGEDLSNISVSQIYQSDTKEMINNYLKEFERKENNLGSELPDLRYFWFADGTYINRINHNKLIKRDPYNPSSYLPDANEDFHKWLGGDIEDSKRNSERNSKKIFSFYSVKRCWGYSKQEKGFFDRLIEELKNIDVQNIKKGTTVIENDL